MEVSTSVQELLDEAGKYGAELKLATVGSRTQKDVGFNIQLASDLPRSWNTIRCYLHTGQSRRGLSEGTPLLVATCQSPIVPGRLDTVAYLPYPAELSHELVNLDVQKLSAFLPVVYRKLNAGEWDALWRSFIDREYDVLELKGLINGTVFQAMTTVLPIDILPDFLSIITPDKRRLSTYLQECFKKASTKQVKVIEDYLDSHKEIRDSLCIATVLGTNYPDTLNLSIKSLDTEGFVAELNSLPDKPEPWRIVWNEWHHRPVESVDAVKSGVSEAIWKQASAHCPPELLHKYLHLVSPEPQLLWHYVCEKHESLESTEKENISRYINRDNATLEAFNGLTIEAKVLPLAIQFFNPHEPVVWHHLTHCWDEASNDARECVSEYINHRLNFTQARFLLHLVEKGAAGEPFLMQNLIVEVNNLTKRLFDAHSVNLTYIRPTIFLGCPVDRSHINKWLQKTFAACEVSISHNKNEEAKKHFKGKIEPDFHFWCRRYLCDAGEHLIQTENPKIQNLRFCKDVDSNYLNTNNYAVGGFFYKVVKRYWGFDKFELHFANNSAFSRALASLNRWNEIISRLYCKSCNTPLRISEHSAGSIGKMAYSVTYWHCAEKTCPSYARSIKLSHCKGANCGKIIDSREDKYACDPWEVRSHRKFYLCTACGSCCQTHADKQGYRICPGCGSDSGLQVAGSGKGQLSCTKCNHMISLPWNVRDEITRRYQSLKSRVGESGYRDDVDASFFVMPWSSLVPEMNGLLQIEMKCTRPTLYVYDLIYCLTAGLVRNISRFDKVYDVKVLERLNSLGMKHRRYNKGMSQEYGIIAHLKNNPDFYKDSKEKERIARYLSLLIDKTDCSGALKHYLEIELPFTLALRSLLGDGLLINGENLKNWQRKIEWARNMIVEPLRELGIDSPTKEALKAWLPDSDNKYDTAILLERIDTLDFKSIRHLDKVFDDMYKIEKLERMGSSIRSLAHASDRVIPDYQIVGTDTLRCTSRRPNLLGMPKQLRPVIQAGKNRCIVECDYRQMEVGVVAALSEDDALIHDFNTGDVYQSLASKLGIDRDIAKIVFLSILNGVSERTLQLWLIKTESEVSDLLRGFFEYYPDLEKYLLNRVKFGQANEFVDCISGLKRHIFRSKGPKKFPDESILSWERNWFRNFPVQASASIVFKRAIIEIAENVEKQDFKLIVPLYDAIVFEVPLRRKDYYTELVSSSMRQAMSNYFPVLLPQVTVNDFDTTCWNGGEGILPMEEFLTME